LQNWDLKVKSSKIHEDFIIFFRKKKKEEEEEEELHLKKLSCPSKLKKFAIDPPNY
jgi:hypothetical protein